MEDGGPVVHRLMTELSGDLSDQLADGMAMPAAAAMAADGELITKMLMPLDTGGHPVSDRQMGEMLQSLLERESTEPAAIAFVRVDLEPPEIVALDLASHTSQRLRPIIEDGEHRWSHETLSEGEGLDDAARGGSDGADLISPAGEREPVESTEPLEHIAHDAIQQLTTAVSSDDLTAVDQIPEDVLMDLGAVWGHTSPPQAGPGASLKERWQQLREFAGSLDSPTCAIRFRHDDHIYIAGFHKDAVAMLARFTLDGPGSLGPPEPIGIGDLGGEA